MLSVCKARPQKCSAFRAVAFPENVFCFVGLPSPKNGQALRDPAWLVRVHPFPFCITRMLEYEKAMDTSSPTWKFWLRPVVQTRHLEGPGIDRGEQTYHNNEKRKRKKIPAKANEGWLFRKMWGF